LEKALMQLHKSWAKMRLQVGAFLLRGCNCPRTVGALPDKE
jgi:hypothetical protein